MQIWSLQHEIFAAMAAVEKLPEYATPAYWEARYDVTDAAVPNLADANEHRRAYDWYLDYSALPSSSPLRNILRAAAPPTAHPRVLDVGCGDSALCVAMAVDGYAAVYGVDPSGSAMVAQRRLAMEAGAGAVASCAPVAQLRCDGRRLPFACRCFDAVIEKGTLDAMLCGANKT